LFLATRRSLVLVRWRQELEHRARDKYGVFDQMGAVGDSPGGPLKQPGKPHLKPAKSQGQTHLA
jgi:hypothetical protein